MLALSRKDCDGFAVGATFSVTAWDDGLLQEAGKNDAATSNDTAGRIPWITTFI